ncbi:hypothetical protein [Streptacidiphilus sp. PAMC 29251]
MSAADGWGHRQHPLLGRQVEDVATGKLGTLRAVVDTDVPTHTGRPRTVTLAFVAPHGGGQEWTTSPTNVREVPS